MELTKDEVRIVDQIQILSTKFPIAKHLIQVIREYGLFNCEAHKDIAYKWYLSAHTIYKQSKHTRRRLWYEAARRRLWYEAESYYDKNNMPVFICVEIWNWWIIRLREGKHFVLITFSTLNGDIIDISTDKLHKNEDDFWKGKTVPERREEIFNLLNQKEGDKK